MKFLENITFRRRRSKGSESNQDDSNNTSQTLNYTTNSMPEMSEDDETHEIKKLQDKIDELTSQLNNANKKVEILCLEISSLKEKNQELSKKKRFLCSKGYFFTPTTVNNIQESSFKTKQVNKN
ncbi:hypothetical protein HF086_002733 [Spodoptera exigua]|uniref:Uncharacterized protein n=1 Tax=Spodoptera exigua TaxID=7107 RepID=A0A922SCT2_SPOEX|nr:hypothetical protein HF086_002733 [Spodoptera exigua]